MSASQLVRYYRVLNFIIVLPNNTLVQEGRFIETDLAHLFIKSPKGIIKAFYRKWGTKVSAD
jgi:hypothetical protein